jgi:hypothetical protein
VVSLFWQDSGEAKDSEQIASLQQQEIRETGTLKALERGEKFGTLTAGQKEELAVLRGGKLLTT